MEAVVIAAEEGAALPVDERPMREVDRADAAEPAARENVPRRPVDDGEDDEFQAEPEFAWLDRTHGGVLVGDVVILAEPQLVDPLRVVAVGDDWIRKFATAELDGDDDERDNKERNR